MGNMILKEGCSTLQGGKYIITKVLGQGGFGITYEAEQVSLGRKVAIKEFFMKEYCERDSNTSHVTVPSAGSRELVDRFRQKFLKEAQMIASLNHPNIVKIYDVFEENDTAYYVMEHLSGGALSDKVRDHALPEDECVDYIHQISSALDYLHRRKTLHFDVKPSNILFDEDGRAVLIDFGISKHYDIAGHQTSSTPVGLSKGFAPLEQYRQDDVNTFTPATDVYALGATLYNLITGMTPPDASIVYDEGLERPSGISDRMWIVIEKSMQPRRKDRPQSISEFLALLDGDNPKKGNMMDGTAVDVSIKTSEKTTGKIINHTSVISEDESTHIEVADVKRDLSKQDSKFKSEIKPQPQNSTLNDSKPSSNSKQSVKKRVPKWLFLVVAAVVVGLICIFVIPRIGSGSFPALDSYTSIENGHEYVDLGLSVNWATCNVGASKPNDYGNYYAWGEIATKRKYVWDNYTYRLSGEYRNVILSKYINDIKYGNVDNLTTLEPNDDVASVEWGGSWKMPSDSEIRELLENCDTRMINNKGIRGYLFTSKIQGYEDRCIFLPASGSRSDHKIFNKNRQGWYWSSSLPINDNESGSPLYFYADGSFNNSIGWGGYCYRYEGLTVRPVFPSKTYTIEYVDLGLPSGVLWSDKTSMGYYTQDEAIKTFGQSLPSMNELEELYNKCKWEVVGDKYKIIGPNGNYIMLSARGTLRDNKVGVAGYYWSSLVSHDSGHNGLGFYPKDDYYFLWNFTPSEQISVRLVKRK